MGTLNDPVHIGFNGRGTAGTDLVLGFSDLTAAASRDPETPGGTADAWPVFVPSHRLEKAHLVVVTNNAAASAGRVILAGRVPRGKAGATLQRWGSGPGAGYVWVPLPALETPDGATLTQLDHTAMDTAGTSLTTLPYVIDNSNRVYAPMLFKLPAYVTQVVPVVLESFAGVTTAEAYMGFGCT